MNDLFESLDQHPGECSKAAPPHSEDEFEEEEEEEEEDDQYYAGEKKVKKKDRAFYDPVKWAKTRWAQTRRQLGIFKSDEAIGYPDIADAAANSLSTMYALCQTYMNNRSYQLENMGITPEPDMFVGDYCDFAGATLWACLALQQAWAEETRITSGYEVGNESARDKWTLANLHGMLQKGYKGEKFAMEETEEGDEAHTSIGPGQAGKRSGSGVSALGRQLHSRSDTKKHRRVRVDNLAKDPAKLKKQLALFAKVWNLSFGAARPLNDRVRNGIPPTVFRRTAPAPGVGGFTPLRESRSGATAISEFDERLERGFQQFDDSRRAMGVGGFSRAPVQKQTITIRPTPKLSERKRMKLEKEQRIREQLAEDAAAERRNPALKRQRIMSEQAHKDRVIRAAATSCAAAAVANVKATLAREYCNLREVIDRQAAVREIDELERRKREIRERVSVCDDPDDIFPEWKESPELVAQLTEEELEIHRSYVPSIESLMWEKRKAKPFEAAKPYQPVLGGVKTELQTAAGKPRKRKGGPKPTPKPQEPPSEFNIAQAYDFESAEAMHEHLAGMRARNMQPGTNNFGGWNTGVYSQWELDLRRDIYQWRPRKLQEWKEHLEAEREKKRSKRSWERNPHDPTKDLQAYSERASLNREQKEEHEQRKEDRAFAQASRAESKRLKKAEAVEKRNDSRKRKKERRDGIEGRKQDRVKQRMKRGDEAISSAMSKHLEKLKGITKRNLDEYEKKHDKLFMTGKGGVVKRPALDGRGLQQLGPNQEPVFTLCIVKATGRNLLTNPYQKVHWKVRGLYEKVETHVPNPEWSDDRRGGRKSVEPPRTVVKTEWRFNPNTPEEAEASKAASSTVDDSSVMDEGSDAGSDDYIDESEMWGDDNDDGWDFDGLDDEEDQEDQEDVGESSRKGEVEGGGHTESEFVDAMSVFPGLDVW